MSQHSHQQQTESSLVSLYVSGFSENVRARDLALLFERETGGHLRRVDIPPTHKQYPYGFFQFYRNADAEKAVKRLDKFYFHGHRLLVQYAKFDKEHSFIRNNRSFKDLGTRLGTRVDASREVAYRQVDSREVAYRQVAYRQVDSRELDTVHSVECAMDAVSVNDPYVEETMDRKYMDHDEHQEDTRSEKSDKMEEDCKGNDGTDGNDGNDRDNIWEQLSDDGFDSDYQ
jgi:RNA recognition motif-containing protein